jgi:hypothetical protein
MNKYYTLLKRDSAINLFLLFSLLLLGGCDTAQKDSLYKNGDIIFVRLKIPQVKPLQELSKSNLTHTGIIFLQKDSVFVYEMAGTVELTPLKSWVNRRTADSMVYIKRVKPEYQKTDFKKNLIQEGLKHKGKYNDIIFSWSDSMMYSSELVWKMYDRGAGIRLCELKKMNEWDTKSRFVLDRLKSSYKLENPLDSTTQVVSPDDLFNSTKLEEVFSGKLTSLP